MALRVLVDHSRITPSLEPDAKKLSGVVNRDGDSHSYSSRSAFIVSYTTPSINRTQAPRNVLHYLIGSASDRKRKLVFHKSIVQRRKVYVCNPVTVTHWIC